MKTGIWNAAVKDEVGTLEVQIKVQLLVLKSLNRRHYHRIFGHTAVSYKQELHQFAN